MPDRFDEIIACVRHSYGELVAAPKHRMGRLPRDIPQAGIYMFSSCGRVLYVGRTNSIRKRLLGHTRNSHNTATFAFLLARKNTGKLKASYKPQGSRQDLLRDPEFRAAFDRAREKIREMDVQVVEEPDPVKQAILEIFTALETEAEHNDFDNH